MFSELQYTLWKLVSVILCYCLYSHRRNSGTLNDKGGERGNSTLSEVLMTFNKYINNVLSTLITIENWSPPHSFILALQSQTFTKIKVETTLIMQKYGVKINIKTMKSLKTTSLHLFSFYTQWYSVYYCSIIYPTNTIQSHHVLFNR